MAAIFDDGDDIQRLRRRFLADLGPRDALSQDRPVKFLVDLLFTAINTGSVKDIQRSKIWIIDCILPSADRTRVFLDFLVSLSRTMQDGALPTSANRMERARAPPPPPSSSLDSGQPTSKQKSLSSQQKRCNMLCILSDVVATLHPSQREIPKKRLPEIDLSSVTYELKHYIKILARLAACRAHSADRNLNEFAKWQYFIARGMIPQWTEKRKLFTPEEGDALIAQVHNCAKSIKQVAEELGLDKETTLSPGDDDDATDITIDRVLPSHHTLIDHPHGSWDTAPAANAFFLKRIRGYPLRAGGLQGGGLLLQNAGKQSAEDVKADILATYKTGVQIARKFTAAESIADIDELGNVIPAGDPDIRPLNYTAIAKADVPKIQMLQERFQEKGGIGYDGVAKLQHSQPQQMSQQRPGKFVDVGRGGGGGLRSIDADVERAVALAQGGGGGGFDGNARGGYGGYRGSPMGQRGGYRGGGGGGGWNSGRGDHNDWR